jgi:hypothetical protein
MSNNYISSTNDRNSCNFWKDEYMKKAADSENDNFTPIINYSTSDSGWSTPPNGWATPSSGYGTPVGVGTPSYRRRILVENRKEDYSTPDSVWSTPTNGWATPSSGYGTPVGVGTPSCRRRILVENRKEEICRGGSCPGQRNKDGSILGGKYF